MRRNNIKNHATKLAKAVKQITAEHRFALTGTPIENRLSELWSIFDFLMPGLLGTYTKFREKIRTADHGTRFGTFRHGRQTAGFGRTVH